MNPGRGIAVASVGWAVVGLLMGHAAAYDLVFPDAHVHAAALAESGHAWMGMLQPTLPLAMAFVAIGGWLASRVSGPRDVRFRQLLVIQVAAFVAVELGERALAGYTVPDMWHALVDHGLWLILVVGTLAQLLTAWLGAAASRRIASATEPLAAAWPRRARRAPAMSLLLRAAAAGRPPRPRPGRAPPRWEAIRPSR